MTVLQGRIKKIVSDKGYGFVEGPDGKDIFFHRSSVTDGGFDVLRPGQPVTFEMAEHGRKTRGRYAKSVFPPSKVAAAIHEMLEETV